MLSSPFNGDVKSAPGPKDGNSVMAGPSGSPATFATPFTSGDMSSFHQAGNGMLGMTTEVKLPHGAAQLSSPFTGDFRPGVDSSQPA